MTEIHKLFAWREGKYWRGQEIIAVSQMRTMLGILDWKKEVFASIQDYDEFGNVIGSRLVFDFDGEPDQVLKDVKHFVNACEFVINVTPRIYFSGNKGFHLTIDYMLEHSLCHLLNQDFAEEIAMCKTLDKKIYRTNSLFRIPGSPASKKGYYKIQLSKAELFSLSFLDFQSMAKHRRHFTDDHDATKIETSVMDQWLKIAISKLPKYKSIEELLENTGSVHMEITPCLQRLLTEEQPSGQRHESLFLLARFFKNCQVPLEDAKTALQTQSHWMAYEQTDGEITKVLRSVYYSRKPTTIGCKGKSVSAELMRDNCNDLCPFSPNFPKFAVVDLKGQTHYV